MTIPAVVSILDLGTTSVATTGMRFEASYTASGVATTVQVGLDQIMTAGLGALPTGGAAGQLLGKSSGTDYATGWVSPSSFVAANATSGLTVAGATSLALALASVAGLSVLGVTGTTTAIPLAITGASGAQVLRLNDAGTGVAFGAVNLASSAAVTGVLPNANMSAVNLATTVAGGVQGVLPVSNGGIGTGSIATFALLHGNVTAAIGAVAATSSGAVLVSSGTAAAPAWTAVVGLASLTLTGALSVFTASAIPAGGSTALGIKISSAVNFGMFIGTGVPTLAAGTGSFYLRSDGATATTRMYINTNGSTTWTGVTTVT